MAAANVWSNNLNGLPSPPSSASGGWDRPAVELSSSVFEVVKPTRYVNVEGSIDVNTRFFMGPNGWNHDFSITLALIAPSIASQPIDWQTEGSAPRNPQSFITLAPSGRITVDSQLTCVTFNISLPTTSKLFPGPGEARAFGVKVKAFAVEDPSRMVTATSEVPFVVVNRVGTVLDRRPSCQ
ncbi:uncharacterized protein EI90DRAFT_1481129 [Cantharellus anzutake]|uniref:uncharacterized protein n=1 Tax=Cantharellus anzutake TaxID=1750568 RepID=UPI001907AEEA|nr:uncharacterized protein EI90DRAFT_1481129 [Cantharellus anzutake]KAF8328831.1 hypothetical protein EI90DRAFT_1481129 [Cantharellus anzutake]